MERKAERATGIEPAWPAWKAGTLPLSYARAALSWREAARKPSDFPRVCAALNSRGRVSLGTCFFADRRLASRHEILLLIFGFCAVAISQTFADLTIVQSVEGMGPVSQMTMKIKGDKARIDVSPQMTMIFDAKKGEMINLMREQKMVVRMPADKMKAAAELIRKSNGTKRARKNRRLLPREKKRRLTDTRQSSTFAKCRISRRPIGSRPITRMGPRS